ncbi:TetR-like C-terminal domain-containing protein [Arthrobacter globiformis]|uniref:TetR-like C-terminal domain-containing protein n=1 Tax=Arthrobacter globiformis TaxID=1665 RepID=UPI0027D8642C|nr:TetR-like C-terminal domain-containing protein [Arthrobacter globiformis]
MGFTSVTFAHASGGVHARQLTATLLGDRREGFLTVLQRGRDRRQIRQDADLETVVDALYGAIYYRLVATGEVIDGPFLRHLNGLAVRSCATSAYFQKLAGQG